MTFRERHFSSRPTGFTLIQPLESSPLALCPSFQKRARRTHGRSGAAWTEALRGAPSIRTRRAAVRGLMLLVWAPMRVETFMWSDARGSPTRTAPPRIGRSAEALMGARRGARLMIMPMARRHWGLPRIPTGTYSLLAVVATVGLFARTRAASMPGRQWIMWLAFRLRSRGIARGICSWAEALEMIGLFEGTKEAASGADLRRGRCDENHCQAVNLSVVNSSSMKPRFVALSLSVV